MLVAPIFSPIVTEKKLRYLQFFSKTLIIQINKTGIR